MPKIIRIFESTAGDRTFEVCPDNTCSKEEVHVREEHQSFTWGISQMSENDMIRELKLLIKAEREAAAPLAKTKSVSIGL